MGRGGCADAGVYYALSFYDGYRTERLPANLLQAQRDFFGAHTFERVDKPRGEFFHANWTGGAAGLFVTYTLRLWRRKGPELMLRPFDL